MFMGKHVWVCGFVSVCVYMNVCVSVYLYMCCRSEHCVSVYLFVHVFLHLIPSPLGAQPLCSEKLKSCGEVQVKN